MPPDKKKQPEPTTASFRALLTWLDEGTDSGGERYLEMRRRLHAYFARKRVPSPDELVDETFNRLARLLADDGGLEDGPPARYCYITARFVFLEYLRRPEPVALPELESVEPAGGPDTDSAEDDARMACLERCLGELKPQDRDLILQYYTGEQRVKIAGRQRLAAELGISANALTIRASRIRTRLEFCVSSCCGRK